MTSSFKFESFSGDAFDSHINASIPTLSALDTLASRICHDMAQEDTAVLDLGCSSGRLLRSLDKRAGVEYVGVDKAMSPPACTGVEFVTADFTKEDFSFPKCSVVISMFTLQFIPVHKRESVLTRIYDSLVDGGVFLFAEKVHANDPRMESLYQAALMQHKTGHFTAQEIVEKQLGIAPIMHLQTEKRLHEELFEFNSSDTIWAWGGFRAIAAVK